MQIDLIEIDFNSDRAMYMQLRNQIILEDCSLPSP